MLRVLAAVGLLASLLLHAGPFARASDLPPTLPNVGPPLLLRLEGKRAPTAAAARAVGFTVASLGFTDDGSRLWLGVTDARTVGGDNALDGKDVLATVAPYDPNFLLAGTPALVGALRTAPADARVVIEGLVLRGSRIYYLRSVGVGDDAETR